MTFDYVGPITVPEPTADTNPATKLYADNLVTTLANTGAIPLAHAASHATGGTDPINAAAIGAVVTTDPRLSVKPYPPVTLNDAAPVATNAALGTHFRVTITNNRLLQTPSNGVDGQVVTWEIIVAVATAWAITLDTGFKLGSTITAITSTAANTRDFIQAVYNQSLNKWLVVAYAKGL